MILFLLSPPKGKQVSTLLPNISSARGVGLSVLISIMEMDKNLEPLDDTLGKINAAH